MKINKFIKDIILVLSMILIALIILFGYISFSCGEEQPVIGIHTHEFCRKKCGTITGNFYTSFEGHILDEKSCHNDYECSACLDECDRQLEEYRKNYHDGQKKDTIVLERDNSK